MKRTRRGSVYLALSLAAACSSNKPAPAVLECPPVEPPGCPVCTPGVDTAAPECPEPQIIEKVVTVPAPAPEPARAATAGELNLPIVGAVEWARIEPGDISMRARIDTGAATTSVHAEDIELVEKDGRRWVHFSLIDPASEKKINLERRLRRSVLIRQSDSQEQRRYVVKLWISLADVRTQVDVTLTDRRHMEYGLLIGRNLLMDTAIVDVSRQKPGAR